MMRFRTLAVVLSFGILAAAAPTADAEGSGRHLSLGEVASVAKTPADMTASLKTVLEAEMQGLDLRAAHKDAVLSVSLVKLDTEHQRNSSSATCVVSATLRTRSGGTIFAVLEGRARAQGASGHVDESALRGAVHGALSRVPEALK